MKPAINEALVVRILEQHLSKKPKAVKQLEGGLANFVYEAQVGDEWLVVRISEHSTRIQFFLKEQWAVAKVRERKVPVPEILEVGTEETFPYMVSKKVEGTNAANHPDRLRVVEEMGRYASIINSIPTEGYGHVFDWSSNTLSKRESWKDFLEKELEVHRMLDILERHKILIEPNFKKLKRGLKEVEEWTGKPTLCHGDLRLKNIILNEKGKISAILDWENCKSAISPGWEFFLALHDLNIDEKQAFLAGYGMKEKDYLKVILGIKVLNILHYASYVQAAHDNKDKNWLDLIRLRLNGDFDLYSL